MRVRARARMTGGRSSTRTPRRCRNLIPGTRWTTASARRRSWSPNRRPGPRSRNLAPGRGLAPGLPGPSSRSGGSIPGLVPAVASVRVPTPVRAMASGPDCPDSGGSPAGRRLRDRSRDPQGSSGGFPRLVRSVSPSFARNVSPIPGPCTRPVPVPVPVPVSVPRPIQMSCPHPSSMPGPRTPSHCCRRRGIRGRAGRPGTRSGTSPCRPRCPPRSRRDCPSGAGAYGATPPPRLRSRSRDRSVRSRAPAPERILPGRAARRAGRTIRTLRPVGPVRAGRVDAPGQTARAIRAG